MPLKWCLFNFLELQQTMPAYNKPPEPLRNSMPHRSCVVRCQLLTIIVPLELWAKFGKRRATFWVLMGFMLLTSIGQ